MADLKIRKLPDWVVAVHKSRAKHAGRSLEEQLRVLLTEEAEGPQEDLRREISAFRKRMGRKYGRLSDSVTGIRKDREARG